MFNFSYSSSPTAVRACAYSFRIFEVLTANMQTRMISTSAMAAALIGNTVRAFNLIFTRFWVCMVSTSQFL